MEKALVPPIHIVPTLTFRKMYFNAVCRTCLSTENLNPIFVDSVDHIRYSKDIFVTTGIKVDIDDGLPQQMCARCINFSNASLKFRKQCKEAETRLLKVKNECDDAAETINSGAVNSEDFNNKDMWLEIKAEVDSEIDDGDVIIKSEADNEVEDNGSVAVDSKEEDPCKLKPAGGAWAAPECSHTHASLSNHSCRISVEESFDKVSGETAEIHFKCDICGQNFITKSQIIRHLSAHSVSQDGEKLLQYASEVHRDGIDNMADKYVCDICKKQFKRRYYLTCHQRIHTGEKPFSCSVCNKQFAQKTNLNCHMHMHTGEKLYSCDICKKEFARKGDLTKHSRIHTGEKPFTCDVCKKQFKVSGDLTKHKRIHTGDKPHTCSVCNKQFAQKSHLNRHMYVHTGEKWYRCDICKKEFTLKNNLIAHMRIHTGERPFTCDVCKKQFRENRHLTVHRRVHTGEKPYSCSICNKQFTRWLSVTQHKIKMHKT